MRSSLMSLFLNQVGLLSLLTAGAANVFVRHNVCFCCLPLKGLFWTSVGGVQVVHLVAKAQTINSQQRAGVPATACVP